MSGTYLAYVGNVFGAFLGCFEIFDTKKHTTPKTTNKKQQNPTSEATAGIPECAAPRHARGLVGAAPQDRGESGGSTAQGVRGSAAPYQQILLMRSRMLEICMFVDVCGYAEVHTWFSKITAVTKIGVKFRRSQNCRGGDLAGLIL